MKKKCWRALALLAAALLAVGLAGCGGSLPEGLEKEDVLTAAKAVVEKLNAGSYSEVQDSMDDTMKAALPADKLAEAWEPYAEKLGAFSGYEKESVAGKDGYAVAVILAKYETGSVQFTLSFDADLALAGLYMK